MSVDVSFEGQTLTQFARATQNKVRDIVLKS